MRLFVAIFPPSEAVDHLDRALAPLRASAGIRRWIAADRWHLTLAFLGERPVEQLPEPRAPILAAVEGSPALLLRLGGAGTFSPARGSGVLWIGASGSGLAPLASRVRTAVRAEHGLRPERFRPHLTVGRWRAPEQLGPDVLKALRAYRGIRWGAAEIQLVASRVGPSPRYERLAGWPLSGRSLPHQA